MSDNLAPNLVLCEGELYKQSEDTMEIVVAKYGIDSPMIVEQLAPKGDENVYDVDPSTCEGFIFFNDVPYYKIKEPYKGMIVNTADQLPKVGVRTAVDDMGLEDGYELQEVQMGPSSFFPPPPGLLQPQNNQQLAPTPVQAQSTQLPANSGSPGSVFPRVSNRIMPPRTTVRPPAKLPWGFDLDPAQRALQNFPPAIPPSVDRPLRPDGSRITSRSRWPDYQLQYLFELVWLATLVLNREPKVSDYAQITEALHRRFRGDPLYDPTRGYRSVHTRVIRSLGYDAFVAFVLSS